MRAFRIFPVAACALSISAPAEAAYRITGIDIYGLGVVTEADPFAPPVGISNPIRASLVLYPPEAGLPAIPTDATGNFHFLGYGGLGGGFDVFIEDRAGVAVCEFCSASFSLVDGQLSGPFSFSTGVYPTRFMAVTEETFYGEFLGPNLENVSYSGTWSPRSVVVRTDAPIPEPSVWILMVAGFLGVGQALRQGLRRSTEGGCTARA